MVVGSSSLAGVAIVTLLTTLDAGYVRGLEVLSKSLYSFPPVPRLVCLTTLPLSVRAGPTHAEVRDRLVMAGFRIRRVQPLPNPHLDGLERQWFATTFSKLHVFNQTSFSRVLYLDADLLVLRPLHDLLHRDFISLAAAPDILPPDRFQSGVMLLRPSKRTFESMLEHLTALDSYDGGDQGFLNSFFKDWFRMPECDRLPFSYNVVQTVSSLYPPAWRALHQTMRVLHFSGDPHMKPWAGGQRVVSDGLAPYIYVWQVLARAVEEQVVMMKAQTSRSRKDLRRIARRFPVNVSHVVERLRARSPAQVQALFRESVRSHDEL